MDNVTFIEINTTAGQETFAIIDHGNEQFTSMTKADYEASTLPSNSSIPQAGE